MTPAALICDTSALLDYLVKTAPDHRAFRRARHFSSVRLRNGKSFELVVHPGRPDGGD